MHFAAFNSGTSICPRQYAVVIKLIREGGPANYFKLLVKCFGKDKGEQLSLGLEVQCAITAFSV